MLSHERLAVYAQALSILTSVEEIARRIPHHRSDLRDQCRRAATSVVLNIAEGAGEFAPAEKARFYRIARRA